MRNPCPSRTRLRRWQADGSVSVWRGNFTRTDVDDFRQRRTLTEPRDGFTALRRLLAEDVRRRWDARLDRNGGVYGAKDSSRRCSTWSKMDDVTVATGAVTGPAFRGRAFKLWHEAQF